MKKLLIATHNTAKLKELRSLLVESLDLSIRNNIDILSLADLGIEQDVEETGVTFEENALIKARFFHKLSDMPVLGDDGGLEIDYLDGAPGVKSKRWIGGIETSDQELIDYTFKQMEGVAKGKRGAGFSVALAYVDQDGNEFVAKGSTRGVIADKPLREHFKQGFPYRQVLYLPRIGKYYNQDLMSASEQEEYNHRKRALEQLMNRINSDFKTL